MVKVNCFGKSKKHWMLYWRRSYRVVVCVNNRRIQNAVPYYQSFRLLDARTHCIVFCSCFRSFKNDYILAGTVNNVGRTIPYCGNRDPFALIIEANILNPAGILFQSNDALVEQGFNASYFAVDNTRKLCKCLGIIK